MKQDRELCNNLKQIRLRLGMSQQALANLAGVTRQTISGVESGQYAPSVAITLRLAKALGCQVEDLFGLEQKLQEANIPFQSIDGFDRLVLNYQEVAKAILSGEADAGISTAAIAAIFGLGFIPLHRSRYDWVVLKPYLEEAPVQQLLSTLGHRKVLLQLQTLGGYDTSKTGEVVATIEG